MLRAFERALDPLNRLLAVVYLDLNDDYERSILISSSGRSGSTWLADIVNYRNEYRLVFEPFRRDVSRVARGLPYGLYLDPESEAPTEAPAVEAILRGRVRTEWSHRYNRRRVANRRLIKEIRATNLMPWIRAQMPELPIVYLLRHPVAVARSWTRLGWRDYLEEFVRQDALMHRMSDQRTVIEEVLESGSPFERHVLRWCLENAIPLSELRPGEAHVVFYEHLRADPERELRALFSYLGKEFDSSALARLGEPSVFAYSNSPAYEPGETEITRAGEIVSAFELDRVYGSEQQPRIEPGSGAALLGTPRQRPTAPPIGGS